MILPADLRRGITARFNGGSQRRYVAFKLLMDSVYGGAAAELGTSTLPLFDIGCGMSLLAHYLHACDRLPDYQGFDHDARKIAAGNAAAERGGLASRIQLHCGDAGADRARRGNVTLLDILHYMPQDKQQQVLHLAAQQVAEGGVLILRNVIREPNWRFRATVVEEFFLRISGWMRVGPQHYPTAAELRAPLEAAGLSVTMKPMRGRTPFNSFMMVARRGNAASAVA